MATKLGWGGLFASNGARDFSGREESEIIEGRIVANFLITPRALGRFTAEPEAHGTFQTQEA